MFAQYQTGRKSVKGPNFIKHMRNTGGTNTATWMGIGQLKLMVNNLRFLLFFSSL